MTRSLAAIALLISLLVSSGCGLVFGGSRQVVRVESTPTGARLVTKPETADYKTPTALSLQRKGNYAITVSAPGYTSKTVEIQRNMRVGIVVLDIVLGVVPVIVDAATGAWYSLSPSQTTVTLERATADASMPAQIIVSLRAKNRSKNETVVEVSPLVSSVDVSVSIAGAAAR